MKILKPNFFSVYEDKTVFIQAKYVTMLVNGSWSVNIDGLVWLPGDTFSEAVIGQDEGLEHDYNIQFIEDLSNDPMVLQNKRLKKGRFLYVRKTR
jgi:hypothetical protein